MVSIPWNNYSVVAGKSQIVKGDLPRFEIQNCSFLFLITQFQPSWFTTLQELRPASGEAQFCNRRDRRIRTRVAVLWSRRSKLYKYSTWLTIERNGDLSRAAGEGDSTVYADDEDVPTHCLCHSSRRSSFVGSGLPVRPDWSKSAFD